MSSNTATHGFKTRLVALLVPLMLLTTLSQSGAHAASSKLSSSQCKQAISSFKGLYDPVGGLQVSGWIWDPVTGSAIGEVEPPTSKLVSSRKTWKTLESRLASGSAKSGLQALIGEAYTIITTGRANGDGGRVSLYWTSAIVEITKSCLPVESNEFCKTFSTSFNSVWNLATGQSISKSGVLNTKRIWSTEVKKWPAGSGSRAGLNGLLVTLDELISEAKAKRDLIGIMNIFMDEWDEFTNPYNQENDYWPCRDRVADVLGLPSY
jgi:hypothetical protein